MTLRRRKNMEGLAREKLLFQYTMALERGDFPALEAILNQAEHDAVLEQMIAEINGALAEELPMPKVLTPPLKFGSNHAANNHRHNGIYQTEDQDMSITTLPKPYARVETTPRRFPFALAAAVLAVILIGGLLATVQFGLDDDGRSTGGGLQNQTATLPATTTPNVPSPTRVDDDGSPASATPVSANTIVASPTRVDESSQVSATPSPTLSINAMPVFGPTSDTPVLCEASVNPVEAEGLTQVELQSRPNGVVVNFISTGQVIEILEVVLGYGVANEEPLNLNPTIPATLWYFGRLAGTPIQGWVSQDMIMLLSECPSAKDRVPYGEASFIEVVATVEPPDATAAAATQQTYYSDLSTAVAGTVEAMILPTGTLIPTATSNAQAGNPSVRRENVVVTDAQITMTHFTEPVHLTVTGYHPDLCQYATVINQWQDGTHITVEIYRELPRGAGCFDEIVDYEATIPLGIFAQAGTYTVDINGYITEFVVEGPAPTATFTPAPQTQSNALPRTGDCVLATLNNQPVNVRSAPTTNSTIIGTIFPEFIYEVVGRDANRTWWNINPEIPGGAVSGWVSASVTRLGGNCSNVLVMDASTATTPTAPALPPESTFFAPPTVIFPPPTLVSPTPLPTGLITPTLCADC